MADTCVSIYNKTDKGFITAEGYVTFTEAEVVKSDTINLPTLYATLHHLTLQYLYSCFH